MNRLDNAMDTIEQRLPVELFKVYERSHNEVAQRHPSILRAYASSKKSGKSNAGTDNDDLRRGVLNDLLWTLYARFEAIAESHRAVHDVVAGIVRREGIRDSSSATLTRGFKELWKLYQSEVRALSTKLMKPVLITISRCVLYSTIISPQTVTSHIGVAKVKLLVEAYFRALLETRTRGCLSSLIWTPSHLNSRQRGKISSSSSNRLYQASSQTQKDQKI